MPTCDKPGCKLTSLHDHVDAVIIENRPEPKYAQQAPQASQTQPAVANSPEAKPEEGLMGLAADALDELAGVSESFTGKPSGLRQSANKARKMQSAGDKLGKLGHAIKESRITEIGGKLVQKVRENVRMKEYGK